MSPTPHMYISPVSQRHTTYVLYMYYVCHVCTLCICVYNVLLLCVYVITMCAFQITLFTKHALSIYCVYTMYMSKVPSRYIRTIGFTICILCISNMYDVYGTVHYICAMCMSYMYTTDMSHIYLMYNPYEPLMCHVCPMCIMLHVWYSKHLCPPSGCTLRLAILQLLTPQAPPEAALVVQESPGEQELELHLATV